MATKRSTSGTSSPSSTGAAIAAIGILRLRRGGKLQKEQDLVTREEPLEIRVRGKSIAITMRTPGHDAELAAGFLLSEGIVRQRSDIVEIAPCGKVVGTDAENILNVFLSPAVKVDFAQLTRHVFASSSCGICGKVSIDSVQQHFPPVESKAAVSLKTILSLPERLRPTQQAFEKTGGLHAAAIFDMKGRLFVAREDVGRHNAVDKVIGHAFLKGKTPLESSILLVSGRASFEIMQKSLAARIPIVCAVSAPSSLAVEFAQESGQTLIGFLRGDTMNVYANPGRIKSR